MISVLIVNSLLFAAQHDTTDIMSLPDATVVEVKPVANKHIINHSKKHPNKDIESLPDAIVVEVSPVIPLKKTHIKRVHKKRKKYKTKIDIEKIPEATVVETYDIDKNGKLIPRKKCDVQPEVSSSHCISDSVTETSVEPEPVVPVKTVCPETAQTTVTPLEEANCTVTDVVCETEKINQKVELPTAVEQNSAGREIIAVPEEKKESPIVIVKDISGEESTKADIDFWQLLDETIENSTRLVLKKYDIAITEENMKILRYEYYPNISLAYSGEYYHSFSKDNSASIGGSFYPSFSQYRDSLGVQMQYEVYRFGATDLKMEISQKQIEVIRTELTLEEEKVSRQLLEYFANALKAQRSITYKEKIHDIQARILKKQQRLYRAGLLSKTRLMKSEKSLITLDKEILRHRLDLGEAVKNIQILSNVELDPDKVNFLMLEPKNRVSKTFEESTQAENLKLQIDLKRKELELVEKDYLPTVYMSSGYRLYGADDNSFLKSAENLQRNSWDVGVSAKWNIFNGYKTDNTIVKKKLELKQLLEEYRLAKINFEAQQKKRNLLKNAYDKILKSESKIMDQINEQKEIYSRLQSAGKADTLQLDYIEKDILRSELNFKLSVIDRVYETILSELIK